MNWFYALNGQQAGPVDDAELARLAGSGTINGSTLVWHGGLANWQPYSSVSPGAGGAAMAAPAPGQGVNLGKAAGAGEAQCSQCGRVFPADEVVRLGNANVCAECKPIFVQRLREGAVVVNRPYAGFGVRLGAAVLDALILIPFWVLYFVVFFALILPGLAAANQEDSGRAVGIQLLNLVLSLGAQLLLAVYSAFCVSRYGGTPGKRICKLRVIRGDGSGVTFWRAVGRYFSKAFISKIFLIGYIFIFFDEQKRGLHDMICDTRVIHDNALLEGTLS